MSSAAELLATMAVVAAGAMLGRVQLRGVRLDVAAMLLFGAAVAHFGVHLSPSLGLFGLLLFLYTVGVRSGPAVRTLQARELKLAGVGLGVLVALLGVMLLLGMVLGLPRSVTLGSFAGFFGSGAALAILDGGTHGAGSSAGFAVAVPIGSLLVVILVQVWRVAARGGIQREIERWNDIMSRSQEHHQLAKIEVARADYVGRPLREVRPKCQVLWVRRNGSSFAADGATVLAEGDILHVSGSPEVLAEEVNRLGRRVPVSLGDASESVVVRKYMVSNPAAIEVRLDRLLLRERYGATVTRIRRAGVALSPRSGFRFRWGDRLQVSVRADKEESLRQLLGDDASGLEELAFPRAALVIFGGGMLGAVPFYLGGSGLFRLGPAFGVLILSLVTSALHRTGPIVWGQSGPTSRLMSHIGLPLFMAQIGNESYAGLIAAWAEHGILLVALAVAPVLLIALLSAGVGRLLGWGALTTLSLIPAIALNTPALSILENAYRERIPGHVYAAVYPIVALGLLVAVFFALLLP